MGVKEWISVINDVAEVAAHIIGFFVAKEDEPRSEPAYRVLNLEFWPSPSSGNIWLYNPPDNPPTQVCMSTSSANAAVSKLVTLGPNEYVDVRGDLDYFKNGSVGVFPQDVPAAGMMQAISFAIRALSLGVAWNLSGGFRVSVRRGADGRNFDMVVGTNTPLTQAVVKATVTDNSGASASVDAQLKQTDTSGRDGVAEYEYVVPLPPGINCDPIIDLNLYLEIETALHERIIEEGRRDVKAGQPPRIAAPMPA